ncbi:DnaD domain protein [Brevibacillus dissolubilis]|uniref:DnaD domain protein n=1 Tax=Brevibacillus dissolubilis TaxID=1844116 RepID=UPI001116B53D|nr:DnaD domain protein [Brevibacillus dissolubilis]
MRVVWNELTPNDRYLVRMIRPISIAEMGYATHLYLPLIGVASYALYQLLIHEVDERSTAASEGTHRSLMMMTSLSLDRLIACRERLEAMGLLEVRRRENRDRDYFFEYTLKPPLSPYQFFQEDIWPVMLLNQVGKPKYEQIRRRYADHLHHNLAEEYPYEENITKRFYEVYHTLSASEVDVRPGSETDQFFHQMQTQYPLPVQDTQYEVDAAPTLDLSFIRLNVPSHVQVGDVMNTENIEFFYKLMSFYHLNSWLLGQELSDWSLYRTNGELDKDALRKRLVQRYLDEKLNRQSFVQESEELAPGNLPAAGSATFTKVCRQYSPLSLLEQAFGGRIGKVNVERAETLFFASGLTPEVVNALLLNTLRDTNMELPKAYIETVRDNWKAKKVSTVDEAVQVILERAEAKQQAAAQSAPAAMSASGSSAKTPRRGKGNRFVIEDELPMAVKRQMELEKEEEALKESGQHIEKPKKTVMDDPELKALYESLMKSRKGGRTIDESN